MTDLNTLANAIISSKPDQSFRIRQGVIVSVASNFKCTVTIGGSTTQISNVPVSASVCPVPGSTCWLATDGRDWFIFAILGPTGPAWGAMRQSAVQSIPTATLTAIDFTTRSDTASNGITLSNTGLVIVVPGLYQVTGSLGFAANATGSRHAHLSVNGNPIIQGTGSAPVAGEFARVHADGLVRCAIGDVLNIAGYQSSGVALNTVNGAGHTLIRAVFVGPSI
jgi:hypothetical protein